MKLYVLTGLLDYSPPLTIGIFSSFKRAEEAIRMHKEIHLTDGYEIEMVTLDKVEDQ